MACLWHAVCFQDKHFSDKALAVRSVLNLCYWPNFRKVYFTETRTQVLLLYNTSVTLMWVTDMMTENYDFMSVGLKFQTWIKCFSQKGQYCQWTKRHFHLSYLMVENIQNKKVLQEHLLAPLQLKRTYTPGNALSILFLT